MARSIYNDRRWHALRASVLRDQPTCRMCAELGKLTPAAVVDHIRPHKGDQARFWDRANLQPLCKPCHDGAKRQFEMSGMIRGAGLDGVPLDAGHHWRAER